MNESAPAVAPLCVTGPLPSRFKISRFAAPAKTNIRPRVVELTLDGLVTLLTTHERRRTKDGRGWSGAIYKPGTTRANKNVVEWTVAGADIEHITTDEYVELKERLIGLGVAFILYSTYSSDDVDFRFRLAIPLTKPIPKDRYAEIWKRMNVHLFGGKNDPQTKDASRMLYEPAAPEGVATVSQFVSGLALDWEKLPHVAGVASAVDRSESRGQDLGLSRATMEFLLFGAPVGQQRGLALKAARALLASGLDIDEAADKVWQGLQASEVGDASNPWTDEQAREIVEDLANREPTPLEEMPDLIPDGPANSADQHVADRSPTDPEPHQVIPVTIRDARERFVPMTLAEALAVFTRWLYLKDTGPVLVVLATIAANLMTGDPLWLMLVGASSGGKTEVLVAAARLWGVHLAAVLTEAALLSGTPKRDKAKEAKGGLLREIGPWGVLCLKDFTSILSMNRDPRAALLAALREVYDGSWTRHIGTDGGRTLHWQGKVGLIAGCTTIIDSHHAVMAAMGERFILYRLPEISPQEQARRALRNSGKELIMREELTNAVGGLFAGIEWPEAQPDLTDAETERLVALATLSARARSAVERDGRTREIDLIPDAEAPARLVQALRRLYGGLLVIGVTREEAWPLVVKVGLDCMPKLRRKVFEYVARHDGWNATTEIAASVGYPTQTARRSLEDLTVHGLVLRTPGPKGKPDTWKLAGAARTWIAEAGVPEMSVAESKAASQSTSLLEERQRVVSDFSGTPPGDRPCWQCGESLLEELDEACGACGWMTCRCGACGCGRGHQAG